MTTPISNHAAQFVSAVPLGDVVLISDYGKGVCTKRLLVALGERARSAGVPILVDPARARSWSVYVNVTLIKANWAEATEAVGHREAHPLALAKRLAEEYQCHVVVTLGWHGMVGAERNGSVWYLPAEPVEIRDVCGAGDTVLAAIADRMAIGGTLREAARLASTVAAIQTHAIGVNRVSFPKEGISLLRTAQ